MALLLTRFPALSLPSLAARRARPPPIARTAQRHRRDER